MEEQKDEKTRRTVASRGAAKWRACNAALPACIILTAACSAKTFRRICPARHASAAPALRLVSPCRHGTFSLCVRKTGQDE